MFISLVLVYALHFLNHTIEFWAPPLAQPPRQPPSSPNGGAGPGHCSHSKYYAQKPIKAIRFGMVVMCFLVSAECLIE